MKKNQEELELEQILREIEEDERLQGVTVPESVTQKLYEKIAEYEAAVEDIEPIEVTRTYMEEEVVSQAEPERINPSELSMEQIIDFQKALAAEKAKRLDSEGKGKKKVKRKKRSKKVYILVAAIAALSIGSGIVGVGTEYKWLQLGNKELTSDVTISVNSEADIVKSIEMDEKAAYEYAKEVLGMHIVQLEKAGIEKLEYDSVHAFSDPLGVTLLYLYDNQSTIQYNVVQNKNKTSHFEMQTGTLEEEYEISVEGVEITIQQYLETDRSKTYNATFTYNNLFYSLTGTIDKEEFEEILNNLNFFAN